MITARRAASVGRQRSGTLAAMRAVAVVIMCVALLSAACGTESDAESGPVPIAPASQDQSNAEVPTVKPATSAIEMSDAVPTLDELRAMGIGDLAAECFITTIDPDGTGRVASAELFMQAFGACL